MLPLAKLLLPTALIILGCSPTDLSRQLTGKNNKKSATGHSLTPEYGSSASERSKHSSDKKVKDIDSDDKASDPVMIGGAYLACFSNSKRNNYGCRAENKNKKDQNFKDYNNFTFTGLDRNEEEVNVRELKSEENPLFHWQIESDVKLRAFLVYFKDEQQPYRLELQSVDRLVGSAPLAALHQESQLFMVAGDRCLNYADDRVIAANCMSQGYGNLLNIVNIKRTERPEETGPLFGILIKAGVKGPYFQIKSDSEKCLTPATNAFEQIPREGIKWKLQSCRGKFHPLYQEQLFTLEAQSSELFILRSARHYFSPDKTPLCLGYEYAVNAPLVTKNCNRLMGADYVSFVFAVPQLHY